MKNLSGASDWPQPPGDGGALLHWQSPPLAPAPSPTSPQCDTARPWRAEHSAGEAAWTASPTLAGRSAALVQAEGLQCCDSCRMLLSRLSLVCSACSISWAQGQMAAAKGQRSDRSTPCQQGCSSFSFFPASPLRMHPKDSSPNVANVGLNSIPSVFAL